jgi:hypothetical protein
MGRQYTIDDFRNALKKGSGRVLVRSGDFVGMYRYVQASNMLVLTKAIVDMPYGKRSQYTLKASGDCWDRQESTLISSNEAHIIPKGIDLRRKENLLALDACLGSQHSVVSQRIKKLAISEPTLFDVSCKYKMRKEKIKKILRNTNI